MNHHPDRTTLQRYAQGDIDAVLGVAVATHLDHCNHCHRQIAKFERKAGLSLEKLAVKHQDTVEGNEILAGMLEQIVASDVSFERRTKPQLSQVTVSGKQFTLPRSLSGLVAKMGDWRSYGGKVFSAAVAVEDQARIHLMYISPDVKIPQHTHKGIEATIVLHGGFSDEDGHYHPGDYLLRDGSVSHSPYTQPGEECLCLSVLTEPMLFTQGVARIFNRFGKGLYP
ncbi:ChrR family anti-sigma-E factor [Vibrio sp.]|uniref:ChrR family anti-sigma-E factor n=1 Tax=Vibrio sp. TaxID=678 RepID=UPI003D09BB0E